MIADDAPTPDERQREVRERRQVAGCSDAALFRHGRVDAERQEGEQPLDQLRPAAALAASKGVRTEQEHGPHGRDIEGCADPDGMADQQVLLEAGRVGRRDAHRGQVAEAGGHAVDGLATLDDGLDDRPTARHPGPSLGRQDHSGTATGDGIDRFERQVVAGQDDRVRHTGRIRGGRRGMRPRRRDCVGPRPERQSARAGGA